MRLAALVLGLIVLVGVAALVVSSKVFNYSPVPGASDFSETADITEKY